MSERRLATVRRVEEISPIEGSDFLELLTVDGWNAVVPKSDGHAVGDLVVYCETDSFLPLWPEFAFLEKSSLRKMLTPEGNRTGYRLRTIKLRGQISEGLVIPLKKIEFIDPYGDPDADWVLKIESQNISRTVTEGDEVTELLNIIKWELPVHASLAGKVRGNFPSFLRKTDSERIENFIKDFNRKYRGHTWEVTTKLDGSSFTAYIKDGEFGVCSRNLDLAESDGNSFWIAARKNNLEEKMRGYVSITGKDIAIQCELLGPGVQGNREQLPDLDIYLFDVYDIGNHTKISAVERHKIAKYMYLKHVPFLGFQNLSHFQTAKDFLDMAEGPSINNKIREGLVFKSINDPNVNFKAIANSFKLADKD
jgi:RNA ligase (TIGR02306 family)